MTGQDAHTGATPMHLRKNALLGAARLIERWTRSASKHRPGVATVGRIENRPNSRNVVPGEVFFMVDLRHPDGARARRDGGGCSRGAAARSASRSGLTFAEQRIWDQPAVRFDADCVAAVRRAAELPGYSARDIVSGAGHDAAYVSRVAPAAMIFVPCRGGISHNEAEFSSKEQCAKGAQVLLQAVLDYDRQLAERGGGEGRALMDPFVFAAVLFAAACHAGWNASIKRTLDPLATTVLIAVGAGAGRAADRAVRGLAGARRRGPG